MKPARIAGLALAGGLALAIPFFVAAQAGPGTWGPGARMGGDFHPAHARHGHGHGHVHGWQGERGMGAGFLRGLDLTEAQRDKVFGVMHASAPAMREQGKVLRATRAELAKLALSNDYDEARAKALTERSAQALAAMAQLRARGMNEIYRELTPEQQAKVRERQERWEQRGHEHRGSGEPGRPASPGAARS